MQVQMHNPLDIFNNPQNLKIYLRGQHHYNTTVIVEIRFKLSILSNTDNCISYQNISLVIKTFSNLVATNNYKCFVPTLRQ